MAVAQNARPSEPGTRSGSGPHRRGPAWTGLVFAAGTAAAVCELGLDFKGAFGFLAFVPSASAALVMGLYYFRPTSGTAINARVGASLMAASVLMPVWTDHGQAVIPALHPVGLPGLLFVVAVIACERSRSTWGWMPASGWLIGSFMLLMGFLSDSVFTADGAAMAFVPWAWGAGGLGAGGVALSSLQRSWRRGGRFPWVAAWLTLGAASTVLWGFAVAMSALVLPLVRTWALIPSACGAALAFLLARERRITG